MQAVYQPTRWSAPHLIQQAPPWTPRRLRLGPLELLSAGRWLPISLVYASSVHDTTALRSSLASALSVYPIFGGRMQWTQPSATDSVASRLSVRLDPADNGVMFSEGMSSLTLQDVVAPSSASVWTARERLVKQCFLPPTSPKPSARDVRALIRESTPLLHVSVVVLAGGGTVVCAEFAHGIGDGASCFEFLSTWAAALASAHHQMTTNPSCPEWLHPATQGPHDGIYQVIHSHPLRFAPPSKWLFVSPTPKPYQPVTKGARLVHSAVYRLSSTQLQHLKAMSSSHLHPHRISTNDAVSALIWRAKSSLSTRLNRPSHLRMLLNFRRALELPRHVPGNMVYSIVASDCPDAAAATSSTADLARICRDAVDASQSHVVADLATIYTTPWTRIFWNDPDDSTACVTYVTNLSRYNFSSLPLLPDASSAVDQLESPYGAFPYLFQLYADPTSGLRVVAHVPTDVSDEFAALWRKLAPPSDT